MTHLGSCETKVRTDVRSCCSNCLKKCQFVACSELIYKISVFNNVSISYSFFKFYVSSLKQHLHIVISLLCYFIVSTHSYIQGFLYFFGIKINVCYSSSCWKVDVFIKKAFFSYK